MAANIYSSIAENRAKVIALIIAFPIVMGLLIAITISIPFLISYAGATEELYKAQALKELTYFMHNDGLSIVLFAIGGSILWVLISFLTGSKMIIAAAGAKRVLPEDPEYKELTRLVENISITAGIQCPAIYIINDESCNAFATGSSPKNAAVTFTTGIIKTLDKDELEGVVAHEISHIINYDVRTMILMISCIGFCTFAGEFLIRWGISSSKSKDSRNNGGALITVGIAMLIFGYLLAPLMRLATSRKQEYRADANAALLTRNPIALANALEKISKDSRVEVLDSKKLASSICIANPLKKEGGFLSALAGLGRTHPPIDKRIELLKQMAQ